MFRKLNKTRHFQNMKLKIMSSFKRVKKKKKKAGTSKNIIFFSQNFVSLF